MKIMINQEVESAHAWVDEEGKVQHCVLHYKKGQEVSDKELACGDAKRALSKLVTLGYAEAG